MSDEGLPRCPAWLATEIAERMTIQNRADGTRMVWQPYDEQRTMWRLLEEHDAVCAAKPRKTGISTATELVDVLETKAADEEGERIRSIFAMDDDRKLHTHHEQMVDFCEQAGFQHRAIYSKGELSITFPNGSRIELITAGASHPGRGGSIHRLHLTEVPFWPNPRRTYQELRTSCSDRPRLLIETTMDPIDQFAIDMWEGVDSEGVRVLPEYHRHFWSVEDHAAYRLARHPTAAHAFIAYDGTVVVLTATQWSFAQAEGFTSEAAAAWWLLHALPNLCAGDLVRLMHDYPQHPRHLFQASEARLIRVTPKVLEAIDHVQTLGVGGDVWTTRVFIKPEDTSGACCIGVDTSQARGASRSVVLVVDKADGRICACLADAFIKEDDLARVALTMQHHYERVGMPTPRAHIENNGIGSATEHQAQRIGLIYEPVVQSGDKWSTTTDECITAAKRAIEAANPEHGFGPKELAQECNELRRDAKTGAYTGRKDVIVTYGICLRVRERDGHSTRDKEAERLRRERPDFKRDVANLLAQRKLGAVMRRR